MRVKKRKRHRLPGQFVKTIIRLGEIPQNTKVAIEEVHMPKARRYKDAFGVWQKEVSRDRLKVLHNGKSYWIDDDMVEDT